MLTFQLFKGKETLLDITSLLPQITSCKAKREVTQHVFASVAVPYKVSNQSLKDQNFSYNNDNIKKNYRKYRKRLLHSIINVFSSE